MSDLISRQAAIDAFDTQTWGLLNAPISKAIRKAAQETIKQLPSAEPEIVRCKECKHHWTYRCMDSMPTEVCDLNQTFYDPYIDFCSLAERRTDGRD